MSNKYNVAISASDETRAAFQSVNKSIKTTKGNLSDFSRSSNKALGGAGRSAGMASIQFQQFFGQLQGGVNPMVALSQQSTDLGFVLGAPLLGSIVGITAALSTMLLPAVFNSKDAISELEEIAETLKKTLTISSGGVAEFSDSLDKLAKRSESLAKVQIATALSDASKQIKVASGEIQSSVLDLSQGTFKNFNSLLNEAGIELDQMAERVQFVGASTSAFNQTEAAVSGLGRKFDITRAQSVGLAQSLSVFANNKNAKGVEALEGALGQLNQVTSFSNEKLVKFTNSLLPLFESIRDGSEITEQLNAAMKDLNTALADDNGAKGIGKSVSITESLAQQLALTELKLKGNTEEAERLKVAFSAGFSTFEQLSQSDQALANAIADVNAQIEKKNLTEKEQARLAKELEVLTQKQLKDEQSKAQILDSVNTSLQSQIINLTQGAKAAYEFSTAQQLGLEATSQIPDEIQRQIDKLFELKSVQAEITEGGFWEKMRGHIASTSDDFDTMWGNTFNSFASNIGNATSEAILTQQSFGDAARGIARTAVSEVISGLVTIGVKKVAMAALDKTLAATTSATVAGTSAAAAATTAAAWTPAAAAASLATVGTNSIPAISGMAAVLAAAAGIFAVSSFEGGGYTGNGARVGGMDGKGGRLAMVHPREQVVDFTKGQSLQGSTSIDASIHINGDASDDIIKKIGRKQKQFIRMINASQGVPA